MVRVRANSWFYICIQINANSILGTTTERMQNALRVLLINSIKAKYLFFKVQRKSAFVNNFSRSWENPNERFNHFYIRGVSSMLVPSFSIEPMHPIDV